MGSEMRKTSDFSVAHGSSILTEAGTHFKVLWRENTWFIEGKLKSQSQEAGWDEYKPCNTLKIKEL